MVVEEEEKEKKRENRLFKSKATTVTLSKKPSSQKRYISMGTAKFCKILTQSEKNQMFEIVIRKHSIPDFSKGSNKG